MLNCFLISTRETDEPYGSQNAFAFPDMVPARVVLYMLSFSGFTVSFMMRNDINIAMVAMVKTIAELVQRRRDNISALLRNAELVLL